MSTQSHKLPRRYAQRRALQHGRSRSPVQGQLGLEQHQRLHLIEKTKKRTGRCDTVDNISSASNFDLDAESDSSSDRGYSSNSTFDEEVEHYRKLRAEFVVAGPDLANPCETTKAMMRREELKWELHCKRIKKGDPVTALKAATAEDFKTFLVWRKKNSRIKKQSTMFTYWHTISMNYQRTAQRYMDEGILLDIRNWIPRLGLDDSEGEKSALYVEDLCVLQNGLWVRDQEIFPHERLRVQESPINIVAGCTSTRPEALVGVRPLLYEDLEFQVFPPLLKGQRPTIRLTINLQHIKRSGGKKKPKKFTFRDNEDMICCAILFLMALAIADSAFKNKFTSLRQIYSLVVPNGTDRIRLKWDDDWAKRPVFRDIEQTPEGICISDIKPLSYAKHRYYFVRLGRTCRFRKRLQWYDLRRGSGKKLNEALTPEERRHAMGNSGDVYERHYMPSFIDADCQAIYLGTTRREDLIRAVGRLERHDDAPNKLTKAQEEAISNHPYVLQKVQARSKYASKIKEDGYSTIKAAKDTIWYKKHQKAQRNINCKKTQLKNDLLNNTINNFHETVHVDEVDRQMRGILPENEVLVPSTIEYELEDRATVARLLFQPLEGLDTDQVFDIRVQLVRALSQLCHRQECPRKFKRHLHSHSGANIDSNDKISLEQRNLDLTEETEGMQVMDKSSYANSIMCCPFCKHGPFSRKDSLGRHVRVQHLQKRAANDGFFCPYEGCSDFMGIPAHFLSHAARGHNVFL